MSRTNYYAGLSLEQLGNLESYVATALDPVRRRPFQYYDYGGGRNEGKSWNSPQNPPQETSSFKKGDLVEITGHDGIHKVVGQQYLVDFGSYVFFEGRIPPQSAEHLRRVELKELSEYE